MGKREHFLTLDFLRGIAALCVVGHHWFVNANPGDPIAFGRGPLAVDLFFVLSGFVIAYSYEERLINGMSPWRFCMLRLIRLYPMILAAIAIGVFRTIVRGHSNHALAVSSHDLIMAIGANLVMLPADFSKSVLGDALFPLNLVLWSLFFELAANFVYGFCAKFITVLVLNVTVAAGMIWLLWIVVVHHGIAGGWNVPTFFDGFPRVVFSFFVGVVLFRQRRDFPKFRLPKLASPLLAIWVIASLAGSQSADGFEELAMVLVVFPAIVLFGSNDVPSGIMAKIAAFAGEVSYPLYAVHLPLMYLLIGAMRAAHINANPILLAFPVMAVLAACSWAVLKLYDEPVRKWFSAKTRRPVPLAEPAAS